jgi:ATP phosphoribosyltransferase regulatory subunit
LLPEEQSANIFHLRPKTVKHNNASALLPAGIADVLPPDAAFEAKQLEHLMDVFDSFGYERVKPPLIEFEETLLSGLGTAVTQDSFRLMDPVSQRMLAVRADMTPQLARIATTRLADCPRPLRLSYAGQIIRVRGSQSRPERQFAQAGAELIGVDSPSADAEVIAMAAEALTALGVNDISIDLGMPTLVPAFCEPLNLSSEIKIDLRDALDRKDAASIDQLAAKIGAPAAQSLAAMLSASGSAEETMKILAGLELGDAGARERAALKAVVDALRTRAPALTLTVDPVENRGFEYHTGVTCSFFSRGIRGELGRGGRYLASLDGAAGEPATGLTLFMDTILRALPRQQSTKRIYLPVDAEASEASRLRCDGWQVISGLGAVDDNVQEARRLGCTHLSVDAKITEIETLNDNQDGD